MAKRVQHIRYTGATIATTVGKDGEFIVNLSNRSITVHDGATPGGFEQARADMTNVPDATTIAAGRMSTAQVTALATVIAGLAAEIVNRGAADDLKADKIAPSAANNVALLDAGGNLVDSDKTMAEHLATLIPSTTKMLFAQSAAPTGWTQDATDDRMLRVVSSAGGGTGGSWSMSGINVASNGAHLHDVVIPGDNNWPSTAGYAAGRILTKTQNTYAANMRTNRTLLASESHGATSNGAHTHTATGDGAWRPAYLDSILATRN